MRPTEAPSVAERIGSALLSALARNPIEHSFMLPGKKTTLSLGLSAQPYDGTVMIEVILSTPSRPPGPLSYLDFTVSTTIPNNVDDELPF